MDASHLFTAALRLRSPWRVGSADFRDADVDGREPHITIGFEPGRGFMLLFEAWVWLYRLCSWMMHSRLEPMKELARLFRRHFATIIYLTCGSSHINGSSDCDAQEQLRARLDCLLEPTGAGIDDLVDTPAGIWWGFRWHTGFQANPASGTAPDFGVGPVRMSIDCRLNRDKPVARRHSRCAQLHRKPYGFVTFSFAQRAKPHDLCAPPPHQPTVAFIVAVSSMATEQKSLLR